MKLAGVTIGYNIIVLSTSNLCIWDGTSSLGFANIRN